MIETLDALLETIRSGPAAMIVVEGQTPQDDPWYYRQWFGYLYREIRFVHQDGYLQVKKAVAYLRQNAPGRPIFGLIDRDFTTRDETGADDPLESGLYRTGWFTLENYFLADTNTWTRIIDWQSAGAPPPGWSTPEDLHARIVDAYRVSLPVAAWNQVVHVECRRTGSNAGSPSYRQHHDAIKEETLAALTRWGESRAAPTPLHDCYRNHLDKLNALPPDRWPEHVTGKAVFKRFIEELPVLRNTRDKYVELARMYIAQQPPPPPDLAAIVDDIRREAAKLRRPGA